MSRCKTVFLLHIDMDGVARGNKYKGAEETLDEMISSKHHKS